MLNFLGNRCTDNQTDCVGAAHGDDDAQGGFEVDDTGLDLVTFYARNLAVPARRGSDDPDVLRGKQVFYDAGCTACHTPLSGRFDPAPGNWGPHRQQIKI